MKLKEKIVIPSLTWESVKKTWCHDVSSVGIRSLLRQKKKNKANHPVNMYSFRCKKSIHALFRNIQYQNHQQSELWCFPRLHALPVQQLEAWKVCVSVTFNLKCMCLRKNDKQKPKQHPFLKKIYCICNLLSNIEWQKGCVSVTLKIQ